VQQISTTFGEDGFTSTELTKVAKESAPVAGELGARQATGAVWISAWPDRDLAIFLI
jgi:hypothetical protein